MFELFADQYVNKFLNSICLSYKAIVSFQNFFIKPPDLLQSLYELFEASNR